jgi:DNA polymerase-3 subunit epsilon
MQQVREVVLDVETTGLYPKNGDRIVEIGCVELINKVRTGKYYHQYVNPERDIPMEAFRVHGISSEFLEDKPKFSKIAEDFLTFIGTSSMVIHNASFDIGFLNHELGLQGRPPININRVVDTLIIARKRYPGAPASLDALCRKFNVSLEARDKHGALIDAELLAVVYMHLNGGAQSALSLDQEVLKVAKEATFTAPSIRIQRTFTVSKEELEAHEKLLSTIKKPLWKKVS